jgi:hypothetical protein
MRKPVRRTARIGCGRGFLRSEVADFVQRVQERAGLKRCRGLGLGFLRFRGFASNAAAVAATEFAIILPFMLTLYLGSIEVGDGMAVQFKTALAIRAVADPTSQHTSIDNSTMTSILGAATVVHARSPRATFGWAPGAWRQDAEGDPPKRERLVGHKNEHTPGQMT